MAHPQANPSVGRFARARLLSTLELRPSGFLFDVRTAESYTVNPTGACLVKALQQGVAPGALWQKLVAAFEVGELEAQRDAIRFLEDLLHLGLLRGSGDDARATAATSPAKQEGTEP